MWLEAAAPSKRLLRARRILELLKPTHSAPGRATPWPWLLPLSQGMARLGFLASSLLHTNLAMGALLFYMYMFISLQTFCFLDHRITVFSPGPYKLAVYKRALALSRGASS